MEDLQVPWFETVACGGQRQLLSMSMVSRMAGTGQGRTAAKAVAWRALGEFDAERHEGALSACDRKCKYLGAEKAWKGEHLDCVQLARKLENQISVTDSST